MLWIDGKLCKATEHGYKQVRPLVRNKKDGSVFALLPGGDWRYGDAGHYRGANRFWRDPAKRYDIQGFRLVRTVSLPSAPKEKQTRAR